MYSPMERLLAPRKRPSALLRDRAKSRHQARGRKRTFALRDGRFPGLLLTTTCLRRATKVLAESDLRLAPLVTCILSEPLEGNQGIEPGIADMPAHAALCSIGIAADQRVENFPMLAESRLGSTWLGARAQPMQAQLVIHLVEEQLL
jgi:hypothetical protein